MRRERRRKPPLVVEPEQVPAILVVLGGCANALLEVCDHGRGRKGFLEISLDNLADEFFRARVESEDDDDEVVLSRGDVSHGRLRFSVPAEKGHGGRRSFTVWYARETESSRQCERSMLRPWPSGELELLQLEMVLQPQGGRGMLR